MPFIREWKPLTDLERFLEDEDWIVPFVPFWRQPALDIYEKGNDLIIEMPLTGINPKDVDISIEDDVVTIKGESKSEKEEKNRNYYRKEVKKGKFYRVVSLPVAVEAKKSKASYKDGILKIVIPKSEEHKAKGVKVKVE